MPELVIRILMIVLMTVIFYYDFKYLRIPIWYLLGLILVCGLGRERNWNLFFILDLIPLLILIFSSVIAYLKVKRQPVGAGDFFMVAAFGFYFGLPLSLLIMIAASLSILVFHFTVKEKKNEYPLAASLNGFGIIVVIGQILNSGFINDLYFYDFFFTN